MLQEDFQFGNTNEITLEKLILMLSEMYRELAVEVNNHVPYVKRATDGQVTDIEMVVGTVNINTTTGKVQMLTSKTNIAVVWTTLS